MSREWWLALALALVALSAEAASYDIGPNGVSMPDRDATPGRVRSLTLRQICQTRWGLDRRHVTEAMKDAVYHSYRAKKDGTVCCEVDHLVPRSLGGADTVDNLWPQPWVQARQKDRLEVRLGQMVCRRELTLGFAQRRIAADWPFFYRTIFGEWPVVKK